MSEEQPITKEMTTGDYFSLAGSAISSLSKGLGAAAEHNARAGNLRFSAEEFRRQGEDTLMASQIDAYEAQRRSALEMSRVQAVAAAQGSTVDANTLRFVADFETEGRLAALTALYAGGQKSRSLKQSAANAEAEARAQKRAGKKKIGSSIGSLLGTVVGAFYGGSTGAAAGSAIGGAVGGAL